MERPSYIVDGVDFSAYVNRWQYSVSYLYREGSNAKIRLSGALPRDLLDIRTQVSVTVNDQRGPELAALLTAVLKNYVQLTYFEPRLNDDRTATFKPTVQSVTIPPAPGSVRWGKGFQIIMEER